MFFLWQMDLVSMSYTNLDLKQYGRMSCYGLSYETQLWYDDGSRTGSESLRNSIYMEHDSN